MSAETYRGGLGALEPTDMRHVELHPFAAMADAPTMVGEVELALRLPRYRDRLDQGQEGACVGYSLTWLMGTLNRRFYSPRWLYREAQRVDEWPGEGYSGTSLRAGLDVLRTQGHALERAGRIATPSRVHGITANRWAVNVDEIRTAIAEGMGVVFAMPWLVGYDTPERRGRDFFLPELAKAGGARGRHAIFAYGASDRRSGFKLANTWGNRYPLAWLPYGNVESMLAQGELEAAIVTDA